MSLALIDPSRFREFAFAGADLMVATDVYGRITHAIGEAALLHHPCCERLVGKNALDLISAGPEGGLRDSLWALGPGRRLVLDDAGFIEGGRRIVVQRSPSEPGVFHLMIVRMPAAAHIRGDRAEDLLADRFRDAIMHGGLKAARQPVVDIVTGRISHFEILARFDGEDSPAGLIAAAEKTGQVCHLDYIMVNAAAARLASSNDPGLRLAVNVSGESVQRPDVVAELRAVIDGHAFDPARLIVEVTESCEIRDIEAAARGVRALRACGVSVSLDDFGAGSASFGYLRALDVDGLKFDGNFLEQSGPNPRSLALMRNVARMCAELGISSVGERVETEADRRVLLAAGVRLAQGFLFGRPILDETFFAAGTSRSRRAA
jgi:EAL domain-containing protein (putative c-di-GMP-specific phosphodiesterase class I)